MTVADYEIAPGVTSTAFKSYILDPNDGVSSDWPKAITAFRTRFTSRFFDPLNNLNRMPTANDTVYGFVVLSCAFMLVETIGGFLQGVGDHRGKSKKLFVAGLEGIDIVSTAGISAAATSNQKEALYSQGRCALLHTSGTEKIRVRTSGPALKATSNGGFEVNRDAFLHWVKVGFEGYVIRLATPAETDLRDKFKVKMKFITES